MPLAGPLAPDSKLKLLVLGRFAVSLRSVASLKSVLEPSAPPFRGKVSTRVLPPLLAVACVFFAAAASAFSATPVRLVAGVVPENIYVQGDSLTFDSASSLRALTKPAAITIDSKSGRHAYQGVALMAKVKVLPEAVVVGLGSNDDYDAMGVKLFQANVNKVMTMVGNNRCLVWVNIFQKLTPAQIKKKTPMIFTGLNRVLTSLAAAHPNVRIVDWAAMANANPAWFKYDSMHPTDAGYLARSRATVAALKTCGSSSGGGTPPPPDDGGTPPPV